MGSLNSHLAPLILQGSPNYYSRNKDLTVLPKFHSSVRVPKREEVSILGKGGSQEYRSYWHLGVKIFLIPKVLLKVEEIGEEFGGFYFPQS